LGGGGLANVEPPLVTMVLRCKAKYSASGDAQE